MNLGHATGLLVAPDTGTPLREYLEGMDAKTTIVMDMRFTHDLSYREIGERLGLHETTVKSIIDTALIKLREDLCD